MNNYLTTIGELQNILDNKCISAYSPSFPNSGYLRIKYEDEYYRLYDIKENEKFVIIVLDFEIPFDTPENYNGERAWNKAQVFSVLNEIANISPEKKVKFKLGITRNKFIYDDSTNTIIIK